jgi:hypothetical protein
MKRLRVDMEPYGVRLLEFVRPERGMKGAGIKAMPADTDIHKYRRPAERIEHLPDGSRE